MNRPERFSLALLILSLCASGAPAQAPACPLLDKAIAAVGSAPAYHQKAQMTNPPMSFEGIVIGDTIHAKMQDKWTKIQLKPGGRKGMTDELMSMSRISDCKEIAIEDKDGRKLQVLEFMMTPPKGMPGASDKPAKHTVWIGIDDARVYRMASEGITVELSYDNVTAPQ